ncbi:hypothetical protein HYS95_01435 [Candidatus Daviesbacteria bacterium]|nr:hypothetical protein [Candidatus Daviesbacteria bacterium]
MKIPEIVFHGTFRPDGMAKPADRLTSDVGYICTSELYEWAHYFAWCKRIQYAKSGNLFVYEINTTKLGQDVLDHCLPPGAVDPRTLKDSWLKNLEDKMFQERIRIREWRFPYIPLKAVIVSNEQYLQELPYMSILNTPPPPDRR